MRPEAVCLLSAVTRTGYGSVWSRPLDAKQRAGRCRTTANPHTDFSLHTAGIDWIKTRPLSARYCRFPLLFFLNRVEHRQVGDRCIRLWSTMIAKWTWASIPYRETETSLWCVSSGRAARFRQTLKGRIDVLNALYWPTPARIAAEVFPSFRFLFLFRRSFLQVFVELTIVFRLPVFLLFFFNYGTGTGGRQLLNVGNESRKMEGLGGASTKRTRRRTRRCRMRKGGSRRRRRRIRRARARAWGRRKESGKRNKWNWGTDGGNQPIVRRTGGGARRRRRRRRGGCPDWVACRSLRRAHRHRQHVSALEPLFFFFHTDSASVFLLPIGSRVLHLLWCVDICVCVWFACL